MKPQTSKQYFSLLTILHSALLIGQVMFAAISYYLVSSGLFTRTQDLDGVLKIVAPVFVFAGFLGGNFFSKTQLKSIKQKPALKDKLKAYQSNLIIQWAFLEAPSLFAVVCFLLTSNYFFLGLAALVIALFFMRRPTIDGAAMDLELSQSDKKLIEDPNSVIGKMNQAD